MSEKIVQDDEVITEENDPTSVVDAEPDFTQIDNEDVITSDQLKELKDSNQLSGEEEYISVGYKLFAKRNIRPTRRGEDGILRGHCNTCGQDVEVDERGRFNKCSHCGSYDLKT